ncbi:IS21 family transposase [Glutamicibacter creatinolyticus]|uniref:IS21 family transposase n=1 Tax=Glutamicibacter TaxID=1742989 RepID=UPI0037BE4989
MAKHIAIMRLLVKGRSYEQIVAELECSRRMVAAVSKRMDAEQIRTLDQVRAVSLEQLGQWFPDGRARRSEQFIQPDFEAVHQRMKADRNYTITQAWESYVVGTTPGRKYQYAAYAGLYARFVQANDLAATIHHEPGKAMQVDWAGQTLPVTDALSGRQHKAYLFSAVLPYSGMVFVKASLSMKMDSWIDLHVQALEYFGGVPQIIIPDNARTATYRPRQGQTQRVLTERYEQFAEHYATAIVPARVRKAKDKAATERAVRTVNTRVIGVLAGERWSTIDELNEAVAVQREVINELRNPWGQSKREIFTGEEAGMLGALPAQRFGAVVWKQAKVGRNYHISADYQHYSVPYQLAGRTVKARITDLLVTVFDGNQVVCEHVRRHGRKGQYSTLDAHVPPQHQKLGDLWSAQWFLDKARSFGPATMQVITLVLERRRIEAQGYLDCQNILDSLGRNNKARLEAACQQVLNLNMVPTYTTIKRVMGGLKTDAQAPVPRKASVNTSKPAGAVSTGQVYVRDGSYYQQPGGQEDSL